MIELLQTVKDIVQFAFASVFVLLLPGLLLSYWLFPIHTLDTVERFFVATVSSVSVSSMIAFALTRTASGLQNYNFFVAVTLVTFVFGLGAFWRMQSSSFRSGSSDSPRGYLTESSPSSRFNIQPYVTILIASVICLIAFSSISSALTNSEHINPLTEFYVQTESLERLTASQPGNIDSIDVEIKNNNFRSRTYYIVTKIDGAYVNRTPAVAVEPGETVQQTIPMLTANRSEKSLVEIELYFENVAQFSIAQLRLWL